GVGGPTGPCAAGGPRGRRRSERPGAAHGWRRRAAAGASRPGDGGSKGGQQSRSRDYLLVPWHPQWHGTRTAVDHDRGPRWSAVCRIVGLTEREALVAT